MNDAYKKQIDDAAEKWTKQPKRFHVNGREGTYEYFYQDEFYGFKSGVQWCIDNPPPEVLALREALADVIRNNPDIIAKKRCSEAIEAFDKGRGE